MTLTVTWSLAFDPTANQITAFDDPISKLLPSPEYPVRCCLRAVRWFVKQNLGIAEPTGFWQTETSEAVQPIRPYYSRGRMCMHVLPGSYSRTSNISFKNALRFRYTYLEYKFHLISQYGLYMIPCVSARSEDRLGRSITRPCFLHPPSGTPQNIKHWQ